jgi:hypothetical protein
LPREFNKNKESLQNLINVKCQQVQKIMRNQVWYPELQWIWQIARISFQINRECWTETNQLFQQPVDLKKKTATSNAAVTRSKQIAIWIAMPDRTRTGTFFYSLRRHDCMTIYIIIARLTPAFWHRSSPW